MIDAVGSISEFFSTGVVVKQMINVGGNKLWLMLKV
jgi:hypothetical protein